MKDEDGSVKSNLGAIRTSRSLLESLKTAEAEEPWKAFCRIYSHPIQAYARRKGLQTTEVEDVLQETMMVVVRGFRGAQPGSHYDPAKGRFRWWLGGVVRNKCQEAFRRRPTIARAQVCSLDATATEGEIPLDEKLACPQDAFNELLRSISLREAVQRVWPRLTAREQSVLTHLLEGWPAETIAESLQIRVNNLYVIKHRVLSQIQQALDEGAGRTGRARQPSRLSAS
jgi:RNA polymerase sigma factor (sigma-70 family)